MIQNNIFKPTLKFSHKTSVSNVNVSKCECIEIVKNNKFYE